MTPSFLPTAIRVADAYDDGEGARHYLFEPVEGRVRGQSEVVADHATPVAPGQFFMLSVPGLGEAAFTYVSVPDAAGRFAALVRRVGRVTDALFSAKRNQIFGLRGPFGRGWPRSELAQKRVLVVAGGCGLAPLSALIDSLLTEHRPSALSVVYGARSEASQVLGRERARWQIHIPVIETVEQRGAGTMRAGTVNDHLHAGIEALLGAPEAILLCGPEAMMDAVARTFVQRGAQPEQIWLSIERRMHCGVGRCGHCHIANEYACTDGPTYRWDVLCALREKLTAVRPGGAEHLGC